ncbi:hypothetical protein QYM36_010847 [Artemia franciscana]|uniref:Uncharacterized protein n=1 Tax=Artemia franciscana TaxID=6661 RepID=A0AA88L2D6_ARTSF|nr:hypothetical protein QYM36_010847 [Artemia franciscana]
MTIFVTRVQLQAILKSISEKRDLGSDVLDALTEEKFDKAVRQLGYKDTSPSLVQVRQKIQQLQDQENLSCRSCNGENSDSMRPS